MSAHPRISVPDFDTVWAKVRDSAAQVDDDTRWLKSWNKKSVAVAIPMFIGLACVAVALLTFFLDAGMLGMLLILVAATLLTPTVFYFIRQMSSASSQHAETVVAPMVDELIQYMSAHTVSGSEAHLQATYEPDGSMPLSVLRGAGFIRDARALQEDFIRGSFGQTDFMMSDVKWEASKVELSTEAKERNRRRANRQRRQQDRVRDQRLRHKYGRNWRAHKRDDRHRNSSGSLLRLVPDSLVDSIKEKYGEFQTAVNKMGPSMIVFAADFHKNFASKTYLLPREVEEEAIRNFSVESAASGGMESMVLADPKIQELFYGWTSDQAEARYLLTPELMVAITDAAERMKSQRIAVSFRDSWMYFAVVLDEDRFSFRLTGEEDQGYSVAKDIYEDLVAFLSLIEHFNLNTRIWSKV